jgi:amino acid transporter
VDATLSTAELSADQGKAGKSLVRGIRRWDLAAILINVVVGAGVLGLPSKSFALVGSYSLVGWFACAAIMGVVAACFAEVGSQFVQTGGPYLYALEAFGPATGFLVGWLSWVSRLFSFATIANLAITYTGGFVPGLMAGPARSACILGVTAGLTWLVSRGMRTATAINNALTACKLVLLVGFVLLCLPAVSWPRLALPSKAPSAADWHAAVLLMSFAFLGIKSAMITTGEMRNPRRDVPFALAVGLSLIALLYVAIQLVCIGTLPQLAHLSRPVVDATQQSFGSLAARIIDAGAVLIMLGTAFAVLLTGSRLPFALAERSQMPAWLGAVHSRWRTPYAAVIVTGVAAGALTLYTSFLGALTVTALTRLVGYMTTCGALWVLRRRGQNAVQSGFRVPGGRFIAVVALAACTWLMLGSSWRELVSLAITALVGIVLSGTYALYRRYCG